jgi:hypothetical protein
VSYNPNNDPTITIPKVDWNIGFFLRIKVFPCSGNPFVAVETVGGALLKAFISFEGPDPKHILHKLSGRSSLKGIRMLFEEAEVLEPEVGDAIDQLTKWVWKIDAGIDEGVWWLFILSLVDEFFIDWSSAFYRMNGCLEYGATNWIRSGNNECVYTTHLGWVLACSYFFCDTSDGIQVTVGGGFHVPSTKTWSVQWTSNWGGIGGGPLPTLMRIRNTGTDKIYDASPSFGDLFGGGTWSMVGVYDQPPDPGSPLIALEAMNADDTTVAAAFGNGGGYFYEDYQKAPDPISFSETGTFWGSEPVVNGP